MAVLAVACAPLHTGNGVKPEMTVIQSEERDGYVCQLVEYNVDKGERVRSFLLVPGGAGPKDRRPGLVLLHDHGARFDIGKEKLVKPMADAPEYIKASSLEWVGSGFDGVYFGDTLAKQGFVVIVPDMHYWGGRSTALCQQWSRVRFGGEEGDLKTLKNDVYEGQRAVYDSLAAKGVIWAEKTMQEDAVAAAVLKGLDCVEKSKIGAFGWSMGAHRTWLLTAFCKDVKAGVALCWMTLKETCANPPSASDYSMMIPALRDKYDFPDIAQWLAPKPFFFLNGDEDKLFPVPQSQEAFDIMQDIYEDKGADGKLRTEFFHGPHHCGPAEQQKITEFFRKEFDFAAPVPGIRETFKAPEGGKVSIDMICHGSIALEYKGFEIQVDPVVKNAGQTIDYAAFPKADLVLVSHEHGDHLDPSAIQIVSKEGTHVVCNGASASKIPGAEVMANGDSKQFGDITVKAVPAYNNSEGHTRFHPQGNGNGYLLGMGGLNIYVAGDTEDIPELAELKDIDIAFLPANQPYTMTVEQCIKAAKTISPKVLIPYHLGNTDVQAIKDGLEGTGIDVRLYDTLK